MSHGKAPVVNYDTGIRKNKRRKRGERRVKRQRDLLKGRCTVLRVGTLNVGAINGRGRELAYMMKQRKVDVLCLQETKWKKSKARNIGGGCKLFYNGADERRNGIVIVVREELVTRIVKMKRVSNRLIAIKLEVKSLKLNIVSTYAPQVGNSMEEKNDFWQHLNGLIESISIQKEIVVNADLNGHVEEGNIGDEEVMGRYGARTRNE